MLPPDSSDLLPRLVRRNARRIRRARRRLEPLARAREEREALRALADTVRHLRGDRRTGFYLAPASRGWLSGVEEALELRDPPADPLRLFSKVARGPYLASLVPGGRLDGRLHRRARALGRRLVARRLRELPLVVAFLTPPTGRYGPFRPDPAADGYEARREGELHLDQPVPGVLRLRPGARLELREGGLSVRQPGPGARWAPREVVPGTGIVLARRVHSGRRGLRPGAPMPHLAARLAEALDLVRQAWPAMAEEVNLHTREIVPLVERGTVSYSLPSRPGVSYINVEGKRPVDLADDLVHETAHHRLHGLEELTPLEREGEEAYYHSPWRRSMRPLHGILHATYTFSFRAELLRRLQRVPGRLPRAWMQREVSREREALRRSLFDLADAADRGLLTAAGIDLIDTLQRDLGTWR